jgi:ADP-ribose pyrophosphatase
VRGSLFSGRRQAPAVTEDDDRDDPTERTDGAGRPDGAADPLAWETTSREVAYTCPGFEIHREDVRLPDGTETDYDYLHDDPAVVVLGFTPHGDEVVLVEEWRQAVGRVNRALPAGSVEPGEDLAAAARREFEEETGYEPDSLDQYATYEPANGISDAVHHYFVAEGCTPTGSQSLDDDESIRVATEAYDDLVAAVRNDEVRDGRTALGVLQHELSA